MTQEKTKTRVKIVPSTEDKAYTLLYCSYTGPAKFTEGWYVNIFESCYLEETTTGDYLKMISAFGIPYATYRNTTRRAGESISFILIFPKVPKHWKVFNFIEVCPFEGGFTSFGIARNDDGIYRILVN